MRRDVLLLLLLPLLVACRGTDLYTSRDLAQVKQAYATIKPIYLAFRYAYHHHLTAGIVSNYHREQRACRLVDDINRRDTIDPGTNLFAASDDLDSFCNDIEEAWSYWAPRHGYPYKKSVPASRPTQEFLDGDFNLGKIKAYLRHPSQLS